MTFPGDASVPIERNQSAPRAMIHGMFDRVSTLFTSVGFGAGWPGAGSQPVTTSDANRPCSYGGNKRGSGGLPSMTCVTAIDALEDATGRDDELSSRPACHSGLAQVEVAGPLR